MYSDLVKECGSREKVIERLLNRCNELGKMTEKDYGAFIDKNDTKSKVA